MSRLVVPLAASASARATAARGGRATARSRAVAPGEDGGDGRLGGLSAMPVEEVEPVQRSIALGLAPAPGGRGQYRLAIRVQRPALLASKYVEDMTREAHGEVDVRFVGRVSKRAPTSRPAAPRAPTTGSKFESAGPWYQSRMRPLQPGLSIGHFAITAGTLGCFVTSNRGGERFILSNNHVLANEDNATAGDDILQAGRVDGGRQPRDHVGGLRRGWIRFNLRGPNLVDCALSTIDTGIEVDPTTLRDVGGSRNTRLAGLSPADVLAEGIVVHKVGRTTGATTGRVTAFEVDNVTVGYGIGNLRFDNQIEIEGTGKSPFSDGGDSGSLIVDEEFRGLALLFAGSETGGSNNLGLTFANPLETVLNKLKVDL